MIRFSHTGRTDSVAVDKTLELDIWNETVGDEALPNLQIHLQSNAALLALGLSTEESNWYAIHAVARYERCVAQQLPENKFSTLLPLKQEIHQLSDRRADVEVPLFSCHVFVRLAQTAEERLKLLRTLGVLDFLGSGRDRGIE